MQLRLASLAAARPISGPTARLKATARATAPPPGVAGSAELRQAGARACPANVRASDHRRLHRLTTRREQLLRDVDLGRGFWTRRIPGRRIRGPGWCADRLRLRPVVRSSLVGVRLRGEVAIDSPAGEGDGGCAAAFQVLAPSESSANTTRDEKAGLVETVGGRTASLLRPDSFAVW